MVFKLTVCVGKELDAESEALASPRGPVGDQGRVLTAHHQLEEGDRSDRWLQITGSRGGVHNRQLIWRRETDQKAVLEKEADHTDVLYRREIRRPFWYGDSDQYAFLKKENRSESCPDAER
jgi:hypothetical protein